MLGGRDWGVTGVCCMLELFKETGRGITGPARDPGPEPREPRSEMVRWYILWSAGEGACVGVHGEGDTEPMPTAAAFVPDTSALLGVVWAADGSLFLSPPVDVSPGMERCPSASASDSWGPREEEGGLLMMWKLSLETELGESDAEIEQRSSLSASGEGDSIMGAEVPWRMPASNLHTSST